MHAIRIIETGEPDVMVWSEVDRPEPGSGDLLVRVVAAGVNFIDTYHRTGLYPMELPFTPGLEGAGIVAGHGDAISQFGEGARVAWTNAIGSYGEYAIVPAEAAVSVPQDVALEVAAAAMLQGLTADYLVRNTFPLAAGQRCLVHAGAGGVGRLLIQMAKTIGAEIFTTVSTPEKASIAEACGADHVIMYTERDFGDAVEEIAGPRPLDVVYDGVGRATFDRGLELLKKRGMMALFGQSSGVVPPFDLGRLARNGSLFITRPTLFDYVDTPEKLRERAAAVLAAVGSGDLDIHIGHRWALEDAAEAHRALEARKTTGKVLLVPRTD